MLGHQLKVTPPTSSAHRKRKNQNYRHNKKAQKLQSLSIRQGNTIDVPLDICKGTDGHTTSIDLLGNYDAVVCDKTFDMDMVNEHVFFSLCNNHTHSYSLFPMTTGQFR